MTRTKQTKLRQVANMYLNVKLGMRREEGLLMNFPKFHGDRDTSTILSQRYRKTYQTDLTNRGPRELVRHQKLNN